MDGQRVISNNEGVLVNAFEVRPIVLYAVDDPERNATGHSASTVQC